MRASLRNMDADDLDLGQLAPTTSHGKRKGWHLWQMAAGTGLIVYVVRTKAFGFHRVPFRLQVPYVPSSAKQVENMMSLLEGRSGKLVDLGSGDGRIVVEAHRRGFRPAIGYELNPWLLHLSNIRAWRAGCYGKVYFRQEDLWKAQQTANKTHYVLKPSRAPLRRTRSPETDGRAFGECT